MAQSNVKSVCKGAHPLCPFFQNPNFGMKPFPNAKPVEEKKRDYLIKFKLDGTVEHIYASTAEKETLRANLIVTPQQMRTRASDYNQRLRILEQQCKCKLLNHVQKQQALSTAKLMSEIPAVPWSRNEQEELTTSIEEDHSWEVPLKKVKVLEISDAPNIPWYLVQNTRHKTQKLAQRLSDQQMFQKQKELQKRRLQRQEKRKSKSRKLVMEGEAPEEDAISYANLIFQDKHKCQQLELTRKHSWTNTTIYEPSLTFRAKLICYIRNQKMVFYGTHYTLKEAQQIAARKFKRFITKTTNPLHLGYCCELECFETPELEVDGMACKKCKHFCYCVCKCVSYQMREMDGEMDSTEATVGGPDNATGSKEINTIITDDVNVEQNLSSPLDWNKVPHFTHKLATSEEIVQFPTLTNRWIELPDIVFNVTDVLDTVKMNILVPYELLEQLSMPARLPFNNFVLCRPSMSFKFKPNATKFMCGRYIVSHFYDADPLGVPSGENIITSARCMFARDHAILDVGDSNAVEYHIPYQNTKPWIPCRRTAIPQYSGGDYANITVTCVSPLRVGEGSVTQVTCSVWAKFDKVEFTGMRYSLDPTVTNLMVGEMGNDVLKPLVSGIYNLPVVGGIAKGVGNSLGNLSLAIGNAVGATELTKRVEQNFKQIGLINNRDKPLIITQPDELRPNFVGNLAVGRLPEPSLPLRLDPTATAIHLPEHHLKPSIQSVLSFMRTWCYYGQSTWNQTQQKGTLINTINVPGYVVNPTYFTQLKRFFMYNAGPIEFRFDFIATEFHTGIVMISFTPFGTSTYAQARATYYKICDLREQRSFNFTVPYINPTILRLEHGSTFFPNSGLISPVYGTLQVWVVNPMNPIQSVSTEISIVSMIRGGDNFQLTGMMRNSNNGVPHIPPERLMYGQMDTGDKETIDTTPDFGRMLPGAALLQCNEDQTSIKDMMRRWVYSYSFTGNGPVVAIPIVGPSHWPNTNNNLQTYIARQFRWWRGGIEVMIINRQQPAVNVVNNQTIHIIHIPQGSFLPPFGLLNGSSPQTGRGTLAHQSYNLSINPSIKMSVPFHGLYNLMDNLTGLYSVPLPFDRIPSNLGYLLVSMASGTNLLPFDVYFRVADDFEFVQPVGNLLNFNFVYNASATGTLALAAPDQDLVEPLRIEEVNKENQMVGEMADDVVIEPQPGTSTQPDTTLTFEPQVEGIQAEYTVITTDRLGETRTWANTWDFCKKAYNSVLGTAVSPIRAATNVYNGAVNLSTTAERLGRVCESGEELIEYLKKIAENITEGIAKSFSWLKSTATIFSAVLSFLHCVITPTWQHFVLSIVGIFVSMGCFFSDLGQKLMTFLSNLRDSRDHRTGSLMTGESDEPLFTTEDVASLVGLIFGSISAYLGYKGQAPGVSIAKKLFEFNRGFWTTITASTKFLTSIITVIKKIFNYVVNRSEQNAEARLLTTESANVVEFIREANVLLDERNIAAIKNDPSIKFRFWCCVATAHKHNIELTIRSRPETLSLKRLCEKVIEKGNELAIQATSCPVRYEPFVLSLVGDTCVGKSYLTNELIPDVLSDPEVYNFRSYEQPIFTRTPGVEYWNGYKAQPVILYDDYMASLSPEMANLHAVELYNLKSSALMNVNMAAIPQKDLFCNPLVVVLLKNGDVVPNGITCPRAFKRRQDMKWKVQLKKEYLKTPISQIPYDILKSYDHLEFYKSKDVTQSESASYFPQCNYKEFVTQVKAEMAFYHHREKKNVAYRMEQLKKTLPETARAMLHEVDPYKIFYAAYTTSAERSPVNTGLLPSEVVAEQIALLTQRMQEETQPSNVTEGELPTQLISWLSLDGCKTLYKKFREWFLVDQNRILSAFDAECCLTDTGIHDENVQIYGTCSNNHHICRPCFAATARAHQAMVEEDGHPPWHGVIACPICREYITPYQIGPTTWRDIKLLVSMYRSGQNFAYRLKRLCTKESLVMALNMLLIGVSIYRVYGAILDDHIATHNTNLISRSYITGEEVDPRQMAVRSSFFGLPTATTVGNMFGQIPYEGVIEENPFESRFTINEQGKRISRHAKGQIAMPKEKVIGLTECNHKFLLERDLSDLYYEKDDNTGCYMWRFYDLFADLPEETCLDCSCQYEDCPLKNLEIYEQLLNDWAISNDAKIDAIRIRWSFSETHEWPLPSYFATPVQLNESNRRITHMEQQIQNFAQSHSLWDVLQNKFQDLAKWLKVLLGIASGITAVFASWKILSWLTSKNASGEIVNSGSFQNRRVPRVARNIRQMVGNHGNEITPLELAGRIVMKNTLFFECVYTVDGTEKKKSLRAYGLFGRVCAMPKHQAMWMQHALKNWNLKIRAHRFGQENTIEFKMNTNNILFGENEVAYFIMPPQFNLFSDVTNMIPTLEQHKNIGSKYYHIEPKEDNQTIFVFEGDIKGILNYGVISATEYNPQYATTNLYMVSYHRMGACGSIYTTESNTPLFAMHVSGNDHGGYGIPLIREDILDLKQDNFFVRTFKPPELNQSGEMSLGNAIEPVGWVAKSKVAFMPNKSKIISSLLQGKIQSTPTLTQPGILSSKDPRWKHEASPLFHGCLKHTKPIGHIDEEQLEQVQEYITAECINVMKPLRDVREPLSLEQATVGIPEKEFYDCIDMQSSSGWPWNLSVKKTKCDWLDVERNKQLCPVNCKFSPELAKCLEQKQRMRERGLKPFTVFLDQLKDERRKESKLVKPDGTRVFSLSPLDYTIQQRQALLDFAASLKTCRMTLPPCVGIACDGPEWSALAQRLLNKGNNIVTIDFSDFGPRLSAQAMKVVFEIIKQVYRFWGATFNETVLDVMFEEIAHAYHLMHDFVYEVEAGMPSGNTFTVEMNSIVHWIYLLLAWLNIMKDTEYSGLENFKIHVEAFVYGDDGIYSVSDSVKELFNCQTISAFFKTLDLTATDAFKTGTIKYTTLDKATFLKRGFKKHPHRTFDYLAPLEELSIHECAQWVWKSEDIRKATIENADQSIMLAYGHGPRYFDKWKAKVNHALHQQNLTVISKSWVALDEMFFGPREFQLPLGESVRVSEALGDLVTINTGSVRLSEALGDLGGRSKTLSFRSVRPNEALGLESDLDCEIVVRVEEREKRERKVVRNRTIK